MHSRLLFEQNTIQITYTNTYKIQVFCQAQNLICDHFRRKRSIRGKTLPYPAGKIGNVCLWILERVFKNKVSN